MLKVNFYSDNAYQQQANPAFKNYNYYGYSAHTKKQRYAIGTASFILPGLGQVINNQTSKAVPMFITDMVTLGTFSIMRKSGKFGKSTLFIPWIANLAIKCWAARDAYKNS